MTDRYDSMIEAAAKKWDIDPALIKGLIKTESDWNPRAVSEKGAKGLGQFMPATAAALGISDPFAPEQAIPGIAQLLDENLRRYGNVEDALRAYHGGTNQAAWGPLTNAYPGKVLAGVGAPQSVASTTAQISVDPFAGLSGAQTAASNDVDPFEGLSGPEAPKDPRGLRIGMSGTVPPTDENSKQHTGVLGAIEDIGAFTRKMGQGAVQGFTDAPAGIGQSAMHQGQQILQGIDDVFGTSLAARGAPNVAARDAEVARREAEYQAATPGSAAAGLGRLGGNIAFSIAGGPAVAAAPMMTGAQLGARALPMIPGLGRLLGAGVGSGIQGAGYGAVAPVAAGNYDQQSLANTQAGAILGAVAPGVGQLLGAGGRYVGNNIRAAIAPFTESGREWIAQNIIAQAAKGGPMRGNSAQMVPGSAPTLAEISGNPGIANLQRTMRDLNPTPFVAREEANQAARLGAFGQIAGTADDIAAAEAARDLAAGKALPRVFKNAGVADAKPVVRVIDDILAGPSGKRDAVVQSLNNIRSKLVDGKGAIESNPEVLYGSIRKQIDDLLDKRLAASNPAGLQASRELLKVKDALDGVIEQAAPGFRNYLQAYATASKPIDAMRYLQNLNLTDAQGNLTLARVQSALKGLERQVAKPGVNDAKAVTQDQILALKGLRDDLLRGAATSSGRSLGSNTAQNLATQNMISQAVPGRLGALAGKAPEGSLGAALGTGIGYMMGGPLGAAAGGGVGGSLGRTVSNAINMNNEAIQGALVRMLLNEGGSGLAALQRAAGGARPITQMGALQRLLYPSIGGAGTLGLTRLNNGNAVPTVP